MLIDGGFGVTAVVTRPVRPKGRGNKPSSPIVRDIALDAGIRVFQPEKPSDIYGEIEGLSVDLCVTAAYGAILKERFLRIPKYGTINVHASLLPAYRGASPIHQALLNGDAVTGVTTMLTERGVDTGPILLSESLEIPPGMCFQELHDKLAQLGAIVLCKTIPAYLAGNLRPVPQDDSMASRAPVIVKRDGDLDFTQNAAALVNKVRAFGVWPGTSAFISGKKIKICAAECGGDINAASVNKQEAGAVAVVSRRALSVVCGDNKLFNITRLQFENGRAMDISECWHNLRF